jgi:poly-gamma-glutamate synthesis protein (capsule biosynthesis protein)
MLNAALVALSAAPVSWTLVAGGDIMYYGISPKTASLKAVAPTFRAADVAYANLEIPLTTAKKPTPFKSAAEIKARNQYVLKADPGHLSQLTSCGFDLLSLANNHGMDYGWPGLKQTMGLLDKAKIAHSGGGENTEQAEAVAVTTLPSGFRVGMISALAFVGSGALQKCGPATAKSPGIAVFRFEGALTKDAKRELKRRIGTAKRACDFLIVAPHWGIERESRPRLWQMQLGRALIDSGADAVLGAHPHVLQGREIYKGRPILYSMGNLISPLPAATAIYTLKFQGTKMVDWDLRPMRNRGGKAEWYPAKAEPVVKAQILKLDALIPKPRPLAKPKSR